jgi:hypothetical protein
MSLIDQSETFSFSSRGYFCLCSLVSKSSAPLSSVVIILLGYRASWLRWITLHCCQNMHKSPKTDVVCEI